MNYRKEQHAETVMLRGNNQAWRDGWQCVKLTGDGLWQAGLSHFSSAFKFSQLMRNIYQLKQAWYHGVLLKLRYMTEHNNTNNSNYFCVCSPVYVTVSSIVSVNCYFTVACILIMTESGCNKTIFAFRFTYLFKKSISLNVHN